MALQCDQLDRGAMDLRLMNEALQTEELKAFLEHAKVPLPRKVQAIEQVLEDVDPLTRNLLSLLVSRGLIDLGPEIESGYRQMLDEFRGREQAQVYSAVPLKDLEKQGVVEFVSELIKKEVRLESRVDPSILGGLVIRVGDKLIDGSTRTRLSDLGKQLQRNTAGIGV